MNLAMFLVIAAFICTILNALSGKPPLWVSALLIELALLFPLIPLK